MREIKFRAWDKKSMYIPIMGECEKFDGYFRSLDFEKWDIYGFLESDILMQYTGLKDKNGKEIYEGDIVEFICMAPADPFDIELPIRITVEWDEDRCAFEPFYLYDIKEGSLKVIGNIYENPELVEALNYTGDE